MYKIVIYLSAPYRLSRTKCVYKEKTCVKAIRKEMEISSFLKSHMFNDILRIFSHSKFNNLFEFKTFLKKNFKLDNYLINLIIMCLEHKLVNNGEIPRRAYVDHLI